jgi:hypothetical protein
MRPRLEDQACFLCAPEADLIYAGNGNAFALCGLGPIVPGYSLLATKIHKPSAADAFADGTDFLEFAEQIREFLASRYGGCLITEHGRVPVCLGQSGTSDPHCYHAHFLFFPGVPDIVEVASRYFPRVQTTSSLGEALTLASEAKDYFLISPNAKEAHIMSRPDRLMRQFARVLVADAVGKPKLASWRKYPDRQACTNLARHFRTLIERGSAA